MTLQTIINSLLGTIIQPLFIVLIGLGFLLFFWGIAKYVFAMSKDEKHIADAKNFMFWGVVAITVMISVWGIIQLLQTIFLGGASISTPPNTPKFGEEAEIRDTSSDFSACPGGRCDYTVGPPNPCACSSI
jgi:hypothetical protein